LSSIAKPNMRKSLTAPAAPHTNAAEIIAKRLNERDRIALVCIQRIIDMIGVKRASALADQALYLDAGSGMLTLDGRRRRTRGGIFFHLFSGTVSPAQQREIRLLQSRLQEERTLRKRRPQPALGQLGSLSVPVDLETSRGMASRLHDDDAGKGDAMRVKLIGRPGSIERRDGLIVFQMRVDEAPKLPRVLPPLPEASQIHVVYLAAKHWLKVAAAVEQSDAKIIVEGYAVFDPKLGKLVVYARDAYLPMRRAPKPAPSPSDDDTAQTPIPRLDANANESRDSRQAHDAPMPPADITARLAQLRESESTLQRKIDTIKAMPFSQRRDLVAVIGELEAVQRRIEALEAHQ